MAEGPTLVSDALAAGAPVEGVYVEGDGFPEVCEVADRAGVPVHRTVPGALESALSTSTPQAVAAVVGFGPDADDRLAEAEFLLVLAEVGDPGNAGALLRVAEATGADAVVLTTGAVDPYNPKVVRASAGSIFRVPLVVADADEVLRDLSVRRVQRVGTVPSGGRLHDSIDYTVPTALVLGNEAEGVPAPLRPRLDVEVSIPMEGEAESLNVATAAAVVAFEAAKQRRAGSRTLSAVEVVNAVGHELRSPLTAVKGFTSMMLKRWDRLDDEQKRELLEEVNREADRVTRVVGELLDISRLEIGKLRLQRKLLRLSDLTEEVLAQLQLLHPEWTCEVDFPHDLPRVSVDPDKIGQVVRNLLENAFKYGGEKVRVEGAVIGNDVRMSVHDEGPGIEPEDLATLFTMRPKREGQAPSGSGFGLWICSGLVERHDGTLTAESTVGEGSTFTLTLPVYDREPAA